MKRQGPERQVHVPWWGIQVFNMSASSTPAPLEPFFGRHLPWLVPPSLSGIGSFGGSGRGSLLKAHSLGPCGSCGVERLLANGLQLDVEITHKPSPCAARRNDGLDSCQVQFIKGCFTQSESIEKHLSTPFSMSQATERSRLVSTQIPQSLHILQAE